MACPFGWLNVNDFTFPVRLLLKLERRSVQSAALLLRASAHPNCLAPGGKEAGPGAGSCRAFPSSRDLVWLAAAHGHALGGGVMRTGRMRRWSGPGAVEGERPNWEFSAPEG